MTQHRVLVGINYQPHGKGDEVRAEVGDLVDDVPAKVAKVWLDEGILGDATVEPEPDDDEGEG